MFINFRFEYLFIILSLLLTQKVVTQIKNPLPKLKTTHKATYVNFNNNDVQAWLNKKLTPKNFKGTPQEITFRFFEENKELYKLHEPSKELKIIDVSKEPTNKTHIKLQQMYDGVKVDGGELITHFTKNGEFESINGRLVTGIRISGIPTISQDSAKEIMMEDLHKLFESVTPKVWTQELLFYTFQDSVYLVWNFVITLDPLEGGHREYYVEAHTGNIIYSVHRVIN